MTSNSHAASRGHATCYISWLNSAEVHIMEHPQIPNGALVLVGDGRKALFLRNTGSATHVQLTTERVLEQENPPTRLQGSDRPGRYQGSSGTARSALEETDWHQIAEERFAHEVAHALYRAAHDRRFEQLVVVAPPEVLGHLRAAFHQEVSRRLIAEVPKDLTSHPIAEVSRLLS
jgi:protein required for attachment to host cells